MKNKKNIQFVFKRILLACLFVVSIFSAFNFGKALASIDDIVITNATIVDKSTTTDATIINFNRDGLETSVIYRNVNDYVDFLITIKNNDSKKYTVKTITDNNSNPNIVYEYDKHENEDFNSGSELDLSIKATYKTSITNKNDREVNNSVDFKITLVDEDGNEEDKTIPINPVTGDNLIFYIVLMSLSSIGFILLLKNKKINKSLLILLVMIPFAAKAATLNYIFSINSEVKLKDKVLVTIDINGNKEERLVQYNTAIQEPDAISVPGYNFAGWYNKEAVFDFSTPITEDIEIEAKYSVIDYGITYNLNGGTENTNPSTYTVEDTITLNAPTKDYYDFAGWTGTDLTGPTKNVTFSNKIGERNYTATYTPKEYTITYEGLTSAEITASGNPAKYTIESENITLSAPSRDGYNFIGWTGSNGTTPGSVTISTGTYGDKTYTANFELAGYTISYDLAGGTLSTANPTTYTIEDTITLNEPTKDGYNFIGWTGSNGTIPSSVTISAGTTGPKNYTANYEPIPYAISYDLAGGVETTNPTTYTIEDTITLNEPTKDGYNFIGWTGTDLTAPTKTVTFSNKMGARSYTATYEPISYAINYDLAGGVETTNPTTYTVEDTITLAAPTKTGYTFAGWTGTDLTEPTKTVTFSNKIGIRNYTATYTANKYYVEFNKNSSEATGTMSNQEFTYNEPGSLTTNAYTRVGYNFVEWNTESNGSGVSYSNGASITNLATEGTKTLYAIWELKPITVTFDTDGGTPVSAEVLIYGQTLGDVLTDLPSTSKPGVIFAGWYLDLSDNTSKVDLTYAPDDDVTLYAKYTDFICKKATTLTTETCNSASGKGCRANGHDVGDTIVYGDYNSSDTFKPGDAFDCDVDGTGHNQRFYYVTDNGNNAVLISHTTFSGELGQSNINVYYNYDTSLTLLPTVEQWSNLPVTFEIQSGDFRPARMIRLEELEDMTGKSYTDLKKDGALNNYEFLFENSLYSGVGERSTAWLEQTTIDGVDTRIRYRNDTRKLDQVTSDKYNSSNNCIKPIIEIPYDMIDDSYIVKYNANGGTSEYNVQRVVRGNSIGTLPTATNTGMYFDGWYTDTTWTTKLDANYTPSGYETYIAKWFVDVINADMDSSNLNIEVGTSSSLVINNISDLEPISYSVEDDSVISINSDGDINALSVGSTKITITGLLSGNTKEVNVTVSDVVTTYNVTFETDGGTPVPPTQVVVKNTEIGPLPSGITKTDYDFAGWYTTSSYNVEVTEHTVIDGDKVFYAKWVPSDAVAEINGTTFTTLQDAFNAVPINMNQTVGESDKTVIKVLKDFSFDKIDLTTDKSNNKINRYVILDLNNHNLTVNSGNAFDSSIKFLEIKNGTITSNIDQGVINVQTGATLYVTDASLINTNSRQGIYNNGGTVLIKGNSYIENKKDRAAVQNLNSGTLTILGGTIYSREHNGVYNQSGTVTIGKKDGVYDTSSITIKSGVSTTSNNNQIGIVGNVNLYDGMIMGKKSAISNENTIIDIEDNATKVKDTDPQDGVTFNRLYYTVAATTYRIDFDPNGGDVDPTFITINIGDEVGTLPTPTNGIYTFDGWYTEDDVLVTSSRIPTGNETYTAKWSYIPSEDIVNYRTTNDAMIVYYNSIPTWKDSSSNFPTWSSSNKSPSWSLDNTENAAMFNNFKAHNCMCADNQCSTSGTVMCDKPKGYSTGFNEQVNVYLSDEDKNIGNLVTYAKSDNGTIYNLVPNQVYYWELDSDPNIHGYVRFTGERRVLDGGDVRNLRDLGGLPVQDSNGNIVGHLAYERLYRGIRLSSSSSVTELQNLGINSQLDLREANSDSNKLSRYQRIEAQNYYVNPYNYALNPNSTTQQEKTYYEMTRNAVKYAMQEVVDGKNLYFHCRIGTDRTGTVAYVLEGLLGVPEEDRVEDYELSFFYGLVRVHRYHNEKPGSSVGTGKERFTYMHNFMPTNSDIYDWYMYGSNDTVDNHPDQDLIDAFRSAMIESN